MVEQLAIEEIITRIRNKKPLNCIAYDKSFSIAIEEYQPYICTAIHNGGNLRESLRDKILLTEFERWYEEDPYTGEFISDLPLRIIAYDSRYEYDLNRSPRGMYI